GKSTLFNALVKGDAYVADQLFATLDTTTRRLYLEQSQTGVSVSDTVGFIRDLPHTLVDAFQATLQEAADADLLLHVVDAASPVWEEQLHEVERVLREIGADEVPQVLVFNKLDRIAPEQRPRVLGDRFEVETGRSMPRLFVSAVAGEGMAELRDTIAAAAAAHAREDELACGQPDLIPLNSEPAAPHEGSVERAAGVGPDSLYDDPAAPLSGTSGASGPAVSPRRPSVY
ncbi:MAG TPA: GTPase, partial [Burkholderiaceae bacterium]|nr:GTPase [Burkholderiaceae bacterium]